VLAAEVSEEEEAESPPDFEVIDAQVRLEKSNSLHKGVKVPCFWMRAC
jgi:hypothetical protein